MLHRVLILDLHDSDKRKKKAIILSNELNRMQILLRILKVNCVESLLLHEIDFYSQKKNTKIEFNDYPFLFRTQYVS